MDFLLELPATGVLLLHYVHLFCLHFYLHGINFMLLDFIMTLKMRSLFFSLSLSLLLLSFCPRFHFLSSVSSMC